TLTAPLPALLTVGRYTYFVANDGVHGRELWRSDGTAAGTLLLRDIAPGITASAPDSLTAVGGKLFFFASPAANGPRQLWKSDGTSAGTAQVSTAVPLDAARIDAAGPRLYVFDAQNADLWALDPANPAAPTRVVNLPAGGALLDPRPFGNRLLFAVTTPGAT